MHIPRKNEQYFYSSSTLKDTKIPKLLFWNDSWVTAPVFHNRFLIFNLYLMIVVIHSEHWENAHHSINLTDDVCSPSKPVIT